MTYPQTWAELSAARQLWAPPEEIAEAFEAIRSTPIPYTFCTRAFDMLAPILTTIDNAGVAIALGAARQINMTQFDQRQGEALAFMVANASRYISPPAPDPAA